MSRAEGFFDPQRHFWRKRRIATRKLRSAETEPRHAGRTPEEWGLADFGDDAEHVRLLDVVNRKPFEPGYNRACPRIVRRHADGRGGDVYRRVRLSAPGSGATRRGL